MNQSAIEPGDAQFHILQALKNMDPDDPRVTEPLRIAMKQLGFRFGLPARYE